MGSISLVLRRSPYGTVDAAEAIRHAMGGTTEDMEVRLILAAAGVHAARKGHHTADTGYMSVEEGLRDCLDMGVEVYVEKEAMASAGLSAEDLIEGLNISARTEIGSIIKSSDTTMIF